MQGIRIPPAFFVRDNPQFQNNQFLKFYFNNGETLIGQRGGPMRHRANLKFAPFIQGARQIR